MTNGPVLVIGAGMGGLATAIACLQLGVPVQLFEQAPELGEVGAGITVYPNSTRILEWLGCGAGLARWGVVPAETARRHFDTGEVALYRALGDEAVRLHGARQYAIHRADLQRILLDRLNELDPTCLVLGHACVGLEQGEQQVTARFANGATARGVGLIGADGVHSAVREAIMGPEKVRFTGNVAWRALVPAAGLPAESLQPDNSLWNGPDRCVLKYPVRNRELVNYVAFAAMAGWEVESWRQKAELAELLSEFAGWDWRLRAILEATPPDELYKWALLDREPFARWVDGRVALIGDAAHPMQPFLGQGAGIALEDGVVVARCLAKYPDVPAAFRAYERARLPRGHWVQRGVLTMGIRLYQDPKEWKHDPEFLAFFEEVQQLQDYDAMTAEI